MKQGFLLVILLLLPSILSATKDEPTVAISTQIIASYGYNSVNELINKPFEVKNILIKEAAQGRLDAVYAIFLDQEVLNWLRKDRYLSEYIEDTLDEYASIYLPTEYEVDWHNIREARTKYIVATLKLAVLTKNMECVYKLFANWNRTKVFTHLSDTTFFNIFVEGAAGAHIALFNWLLAISHHNMYSSINLQDMFINAINAALSKNRYEIIKAMMESNIVRSYLSTNDFEDILERVSDSMKEHVKSAIDFKNSSSCVIL